MTYREKAAEIISNYLGMSIYQAQDIIHTIDEQCEYKPSVIGRLHAPKDLENWDAEIDHNSMGYKIAFYNEWQYNKNEILHLPITMNGKPIGVITDVTDNEIIGHIWHKKVVLEITQADNIPISFEMMCE